MNKSELVNEIAKVLTTKKDAQAAVDAVLQAITSALVNGEAVTLVGFGTFKTVERQARKGRNPQTGAEMEIAGKKVPKFLPGKNLKDAVDGE